MGKSAEICCTRNQVRSALFPEVFRFRLDNVENDPIFGSADGLMGEIPFIRPTKVLQEYRAYLEANPAIADNIAYGIVSKYRDLWGDLEDDEIFKLARNQASSLLLVLGPEWQNVQRRDCLTQLLVLTFTMDRIFDKHGVDGIPDPDTYDYAELIAKLRSKDEPEAEDMPSGLVQFEMMSRLSKTVFAETEKVVPGWSKYYPVIRDDVISVITAHLATFELDRDKNGPRYSEETMIELRRAISGVKLIIGIGALFHDINITNDIRKDDLFQITVNRATDIAAVMNGILGLSRDINLQQIDSPITCSVVHDRVSLQTAFDTSVKQIHALYNDYVVASQKLLKLYRNCPTIKAHVDFVDSFLDGMLYGYNSAELYGVHDKSEIVPNPNSSTK